jgi:hypothetical protein
MAITEAQDHREIVDVTTTQRPHVLIVVGGLFRSFAFRDGNLITGQRQYSGAAVAKLVIESLGIEARRENCQCRSGSSERVGSAAMPRVCSQRLGTT